MQTTVPARYLRQIIFPGIGESGQTKLRAARVLVVGVGATGSVIASTLARAGVGYIKIADRDFVELHNLQRQLLFDEADAAARAPKAIAAAQKLARVNSAIQIEPCVTDVNAENIEALMADAALVLDGTDNFETRFLVNDACVKHNKAWIYGGAVASYGASMTIVPNASACLRCVFRHAPPPGALPTCDTAGVIAPIVNVIGSLVAAEALKFLVGQGARNRGLINIDLWENTFDAVAVERRADCPCCVKRQFDFLADARADAAFLCGRNAVQIRPAQKHTLDLAQLAARLAPLGAVTQNEYLLHFARDDFELTIFPDARAIIQGTDDASVARSVYAKYVGM
ncbi:thiazole biosynthesis adenylyltransferase ThiF [Anaerolineae bacterium CFX7]|nr:thiazole biosynthesis adenylyltransferase ThiF [Anaerolineae bacterium CFX7]